MWAASPTYNIKTASIQSADLTNWPQGTSPHEVGKRVAEHFLATPHTNFGSSKSPGHITYPEACAWYGSLTFAKESGDSQLAAKLGQRFEPIFGPEAKLIPTPDHVDNTVFGIVPLELYIQTKEPRYLTMGQSSADAQWEPPKSNTGKAKEYYDAGLTKQTRLWIDDMYMITSVQTQAYRATNDRKYIDRAAQEMVFYLDKLQRLNGLFYHGLDAPFHWGRGNGWVAAGMAEMLRSLPADNPDRPRILRGYQRMMSSLRSYQAESGMWRQLIDDPQSWPESSSTAMFTFAMVTGVKNGWLDANLYAPTARKGWLALVSNLDSNADVGEVCEGTGKSPNRQFYLDRKRIKGDMHGQAALLWCATALLRS